ncbi:MAG: hypothetical protein ACXWLB_26900, partial [Reyranella sp.]
MLALLAASEDGATDALLRAHGFTVAMMVSVVQAGLATAQAERTSAGRAVEMAKGADHGCRAAGAGGTVRQPQPCRSRSPTARAAATRRRSMLSV